MPNLGPLTEESSPLQTRDANADYFQAKTLVLALDEDLRIPSYYENPQPLVPSDVSARRFLLAMLEYAPTAGVRYVIESILHDYTQRLEYLAASWYWGLICPLAAMGRKSQSHRISLETPTPLPSRDGIPILTDTATPDERRFARELGAREDGRTSVCRLVASREGEVCGEACHILPFTFDPEDNKQTAERSRLKTMISAFSGVDPDELSGNKINQACNGLLLSHDEHMAWDEFAWTLKPDVNEQGIPVPNQYEVCRYAAKRLIAIAPEGHIIRFMDARDASCPTDLPKPAYLALHSAVAGIIYKSGAVDAIREMLDHAEDISALASDGSTSLSGLYVALALIHQ